MGSQEAGSRGRQVHNPPPAMSVWLLLIRPLLLGLFLWLVLNIAASAGIRMLLGWESPIY